jgi:hypothetical protein
MIKSELVKAKGEELRREGEKRSEGEERSDMNEWRVMNESGDGEMKIEEEEWRREEE